MSELSYDCIPLVVALNGEKCLIFGLGSSKSDIVSLEEDQVVENAEMKRKRLFSEKFS